jgi:hypothetical protein
LSANPIPALLVALTLCALAGCGQVRNANAPARAAFTNSAKAQFILAADRICAGHFETVLAWLRQPRTGDRWQRRAARDEGIYHITGHTIQRLETLGPPPGLTAGAFTGYVKTLKARADLYRLTSMADLQRDRLLVVRLQRNVDQVDSIGDHDAHRYGLRICGIGPRALATAPSVGD